MTIMGNLTLLLILILGSITTYAQLPFKKEGRIVEVNNAKIYYEEYGEGEPLLLLHGFLNTADNWERFIEKYSKKYRVIVWDMRGHGRSSNPDAYKEFQHQQTATDLLKFMELLKIDKAKAIGHSSGAITLLYASSIAPEKFEAIISIAAQTHFSDPVRNWIKSGIWEKYFNNAELDSLHGHEKAANLKKQFYGFVTLKGDPELSKSLLQKIKARTLVVHGDNDFIPISQALEIFQNVPGARIWISPNTGHMPQYGDEFASDFIRRSLEFLNGSGW